jgi:hypothetical protein
MIRGKRNPVVHVLALKKNADAEIEIRVTPDVLDMTEFAKGAQDIRWKLDTVGFHSPVDGTAIEFTSPGAEKTFGKVVVTCDGKLAAVHNKNRDGLAYAYTVRVVEKVSGKLIELDPTVGNNTP